MSGKKLFGQDQVVPARNDSTGSIAAARNDG
jgi:hypothetical protein